MTEIGALLRDTEIHTALYTDASVFEQEMKRFFHDGWVYVGHESEIPRRGDYLRRSIGLEPVILVRGKDGIHVLANRCAHRGNLLCQAEKGNRRAFACQYHGWVFGANGDLLDVPYPEGFDLDRAKLHLKRARTGIYRGFVFASFSESSGSLEDYLGNARTALDRAANLSPSGEIALSGTWVKHLFHANWKMIAENDTDGYHVNFVHDSFAKGVKVQYKYENVLSGEEDKLTAIARDLGGGHSELDYGPTYKQMLVWLAVKPDRYPDYTEAMQARYGVERAEEILRAGPPHTFIFPNLFIAETCLTMIQPIGVGQTIHWHTPLYLKDAPEEVNRRLLRLGEVALGPSAFLTADDAIIAERQWRAMAGSPGWLDISRGADRETRQDDGSVTSHYTDETPLRGFWRHYRALMADAA